MTVVRGHCPMGCGETLIIGAGDYIVCGYLQCPQPTAIADILDDRETEHIVEFSNLTFTVLHPLRERLQNAVLDCNLGEFCASLPGPPIRRGRYRVLNDGEWKFSPMEESSS